MIENHDNEQYFFDSETVQRLARFIKQYDNPCLLCSPTVAKEVEKMGIECCVLDIDERFSNLQGYRFYDIKNPTWIDEKFGIILCDPPFFNVKFSQLIKAIRMLSHFDFKQPLLVSYLSRRGKRFLKTFSFFNLVPTGFKPTYVSVSKSSKNDIEFYGNITEEKMDFLFH